MAAPEPSTPQPKRRREPDLSEVSPDEKRARQEEGPEIEADPNHAVLAEAIMNIAIRTIGILRGRVERRARLLEDARRAIVPEDITRRAPESASPADAAGRTPEPEGPAPELNDGQAVSASSHA
eukprot:9404213-Pyramimonas_sp.AAC.1